MNLTNNRQFLITKEPVDDLEEWNRQVLGEFTIHSHPNLPVTTSIGTDHELCLLGYLFDYQNTTYSNQQILDEIATNTEFSEVIKASDKYSGQFVLLFRKNNQIKIVGDAAGQRALYYDSGFTSFASQPNLIEKTLKLIKDDSADATEFYQSPEFQRARVYTNNYTEYKNVFRLSPNHHIDVAMQQVTRFFPYNKRVERDTKSVASEAAAMLKGFIEAANFRHDLGISVTAGFDSRIFFSATHDYPDGYYFVFKHRDMDDEHKDVSTPKLMLERLGYDFHVISYNEKEVDKSKESLFIESIDNPRLQSKYLIFNGFGKNFKDKMVLNGNVSEIGRNLYTNLSNPKGRHLAYLSGYKGYSYVEKIQDKWLDEAREIVKESGYDILDFFYWEERIPNWAGKTKAETELVCDLYSPFNSRSLLALMLSTKRNDRDFYTSKLHYEIIRNLYPKALEFTINPFFKKRIIRLMIRLRIYGFYKKLTYFFHLLNS